MTLSSAVKTLSSVVTIAVVTLFSDVVTLSSVVVTPSSVFSVIKRRGVIKCCRDCIKYHSFSVPSSFEIDLGRYTNCWCIGNGIIDAIYECLVAVEQLQLTFVVA